MEQYSAPHQPTGPRRQARNWKNLSRVEKTLVIITPIIFFFLLSIAFHSSNSTNTSNISSSQPAQSQASSKTQTSAQPAQQAPQDTHPHFGDGTLKVGTDIQPGTYRTRTGSPGCYWERMKDFTGGIDSFLANDNTDNPAVVTILPTDAGFKSQNCGTWTQDLSAITTSQTTFGDGVYIVGTDMLPGTYKSSGQTGCYWERMKDFTGSGSDSILANDSTDTPAIVTIQASDKGFKSKDCGTWTNQ